ncbi:MAG: cyclic nucleotide-binding domain-containing protein [Pseudomonadota bacterium]
MIDDALEERISLLTPVNKLSQSRQATLLAQADVLELKRKTIVFREGDKDDYTFYLLDGELDLTANDQLIKSVLGGDGSSFQPLAQLQPRQMTATAKSKVRVLRLKRRLMDQLLSLDEDLQEDEQPQIEVEEVDAPAGDWMMLLLQSELFSRLKPSQVQQLLDQLESVSFEQGETVIKQGEFGDYYYIIQSGELEVVRAGSKGKEVRLATIGVGDTFGEEALVSTTKRNATVRMLTAGELARLSKEAFLDLVKTPLLRAVDRDAAQALVTQGARWLDVRFADEHQRNGLDHSINIPINALRMKFEELDQSERYVAYCDTGGRSSAAAFLLAQNGFEAFYVKDGAVDEMQAQASISDPNAMEETFSDPVIEANVVATELSVEFEQASIQVERAKQLMAEAEAVKAQAKELVAQQLAEERAKHEQEMRDMAERLKEAEKVKAHLNAEKDQAVLTAAQTHEALLDRLKKTEKTANENLEKERSRLEKTYQKQAEKIANDKAAREASLRDSFTKELEAERRKFESAFAKRTEELAQARSERLDALRARKAAKEESDRIVENLKSRQEQLAELKRTHETERNRLVMRAQKLEAETAKANEEKRQALEARDDAHRRVDEASRLAAQSAKEPAELSTLEDQARDADDILEKATEVAEAATNALEENDVELERAKEEMSEINLQMQQELDEWVNEQEAIQETTDQRGALLRQKEIMDRIKARAAESALQTEEHNKSLLDEIAGQLDD